MKNSLFVLAVCLGLVGCVFERHDEKNLVGVAGLESGVTKDIDLESDELQEIRIGGKMWKVEIANTDKERSQGLMYREKLEQGHGILFVFEEPKKYGFWMKNTLIPLDIVWLDENLEVVDVQTAEPCPIDIINCPVYTPKKEARFVLEVNAGEFK